MLSSCQHIIVVQQKTEAWRQQQRTLYVFFQHSPDLKSYNRAMCVCVTVHFVKSSLNFHPSSSADCKGFTPTSFNICFACTIKLCHHHEAWYLRRSQARALGPSRTGEKRGLLNHSLSRKPPLLYLFIYGFVAAKCAVVITTAGFLCNLWTAMWTQTIMKQNYSTCVHVFYLWTVMNWLYRLFF